MQYNPGDCTEASFQLIPEGDYGFVVVHAEEKTSTNGNEMIALTLAVNVGRERELMVYANLVNTIASLWKVKQFCAAVGMDFGVGQIVAYDTIGYSGIAHLSLGKPNNQGRRYMQVAYYCERKGYEESPAAQQPTARPGAQAQTSPQPQSQSAATYDIDGSDELPGCGADEIPF